MNKGMTIKLSEDYMLQKRERSGEDDFLFNIKSGEIYRLNGSAHDFISLCDGKRTYDEVVGEFCHAYRATREQVSADFMPLVAHLMELGIVLGCQTAHGERSPNQ